jgi:hypothetical protein
MCAIENYEQKWTTELHRYYIHTEASELEADVTNSSHFIVGADNPVLMEGLLLFWSH